MLMSVNVELRLIILFRAALLKELAFLYSVNIYTCIYIVK